MKKGDAIHDAPPPSSRRPLWGEILGLLLASLALGWIYNKASPMGIQFHQTADDSRVAATEYSNETGSMSVELLGGAPVRHVLSGIPRNEGKAAGGVLEPGSADHSIPKLSWAETSALSQAGKVILVDVRAANYYQADHIPGAVSLPANFSPAEIGEFTRKYSQETPIVLYCGSAKCPLSNYVAEMLKTAHGFTNIMIMPGGYEEYRLAQGRFANHPESLQ